MNVAAQRGRFAGNDEARARQASCSMTGNYFVRVLRSDNAALVIRKGASLWAAP
jgi:hypothetical protein